MSDVRTPGSGRLNLGPDEQRFVIAKWKTIRQAQQDADRAYNNWTRILAEINDYLDRSNIREPLGRVRVLSESLALRDAVEAVDWRQRHAQRHIADLNLFLKMKELEVL